MLRRVSILFVIANHSESKSRIPIILTKTFCSPAVQGLMTCVATCDPRQAIDQQPSSSNCPPSATIRISTLQMAYESELATGSKEWTHTSMQWMASPAINSSVTSPGNNSHKDQTIKTTIITVIVRMNQVDCQRPSWSTGSVVKRITPTITTSATTRTR